MITHLACRLLVLLILIIAALPVQALEKAPQGVVRVGIFPFEPFNYMDSNGHPQGLNIDLLREIASDEELTFVFVPGSWAEGLERLQKQQIDLMLSVAYSPERAKIMDYTYGSVAELWGQVFFRPQDASKNINDLVGRRVAIMGKDISGSNFIKTAEKFSVHCEIAEYATHAEVFAAVQKGDADAGVAPQHFGLRHAGEYNLVASSIMFSPFSIFFASKKGTNHELLSAIDAHLSQWKKSPDSFYFQQLDYWLGNRSFTEKIPTWLIYASLAVAIAICIFAVFFLLLKKTVKRQTRELRESEERYRMLIELAVDGILLGSHQGIITEANQCMCAMLDMAREDLIGKHISELPFNTESLIHKPFRFDLLNKGEIVRQERKFTRPNGTEIQVEMQTRMMPDGTYQSFYRDISERREMEDALRESEKRHRSYLQNTPYGVFVSDEFGRYQQVNPSACRISGYEEDELLAMSISDLLLEERLQDDMIHFETLLNEGKSACEIPIRMKTGEKRWWSVTAVKIGETRYLGFCNDITRRKQAEDEILETNRLFNAVLKGASDAIFVKDLQFRYLLANPATCRAMGLKEFDIIGKTDDEILPPESLNNIHEADRKVVATGRTVMIEETVTTSEGTSYFLANKSQYLSADGEVLGIIGIARDITAVKKAEKEHQKLERQLQQAQKMEAIGTLAGGIAHDFNNILGALLGYAELAKDDCIPGSTLDGDLGEILKAGHRAKDLVKQILAFSRQDITERVATQPAEIIGEAVKMLRPSLPATIEIRLDLAPDTGSVFADPSQLHQAIINLCTNAYHAMEETGGLLGISLKATDLSIEDLPRDPQLNPGRFVQISISDTGVGMSPEIRERIFEPYFTTKEPGKGTGLGLSIIHGIVKGHGGTISCYSKPAEGTVFHIFLPVMKDESPVDTVVQEAIQGGSEHILFVDDEEMLAEMARTMLQRLGYTVTVRNSSLEALTSFQNQPEIFDLVITDQTMPGMTGIDLARRMLQIRPDLPIILCTGFSTQISEDRARAMGIREFAFKPLAKRDISLLIRKALAKREEVRDE